MTTTFSDWLKAVDCELEGAVDSYNLDVNLKGFG